VRKKADDLVTKARGQSGTATEQAFADLAKGNSEDPATAKNGGQVAGLVKKNPNKPDDPYQKTLDMKPGEVTDPVKYKNAYYILRRGEGVPKTFEMAKPELLVSLRNRRGYTIAQKIAQKAEERLKQLKDPQKVAQELAAEANMNAADMVRETPFVKAGDDVPNIGSSQQFEDAIAPLTNANDVGERTGVKNGFAVPMLIDKRDPRIPDFDEIKDKVSKAVKDEKAKAQQEQAAKDIIASAKTPADLKAAAQKYGLEAKAEANYKIGTPLADLGSSTILDDPLYKSGNTGTVLSCADLSERKLHCHRRNQTHRRRHGRIHQAARFTDRNRSEGSTRSSVRGLSFDSEIRDAARRQNQDLQGRARRVAGRRTGHRHSDAPAAASTTRLGSCLGFGEISNVLEWCFAVSKIGTVIERGAVILLHPAILEPKFSQGGSGAQPLRLSDAPR
jgi:parvulin-like peptidyl-prolyl isomerase